MKIDTERLELVALLPQQLKLLTTNIEKLEEELDAKYKAEPMEGFFLDIVKGQVEATEKDSENYFWHSFWLLIRKSDRVIVGSADFKDIPNKDCEVEIGYGLGKDFEHNGYMTEAVMAMSGTLGCGENLTAQKVSEWVQNVGYGTVIGCNVGTSTGITSNINPDEYVIFTPENIHIIRSNVE